MVEMRQLLEVVQRIERKIDTDKVEWLDINQAAVYLHLSRATIYTMTSRSLIQHYKPGKKLVFLRSDLDEWLSKNRVRTRSELQEDEGSQT